MFKLIRVLLTGVVLYASYTHAAVPTVVEWQAANGLRVHLVEAHQLPMLDLRLVFDGGSARDGERFGLAYLSQRSLLEGTPNMDGNAIAAAIDALGAILKVDVSQDMTTVSLRTLSDAPTLQKATGLLAQILKTPAFNPVAVNRVRSEQLALIRENNSSPAILAQQAFFKTLYDQHPYAHPVEGTQTIVSTLTAEETRAFYQKYDTPKNAILVLVGDIKQPAAKQLADLIARALPPGEKAAILPTPRALNASKVTHIAYPSVQTHIQVGSLGIARNDADYFPLYVGNYVLGGNPLVSQLFDVVRKQNGLAYDVHSYFLPMQVAGPFMIGLQTRSDEAAKALTLSQSLLKNFIEKGPEQAALTAAKQNIVSGFPLRLDSNSAVANLVTVVGFYNLPKDYLLTFPDKVNRVTQQDVQAAFIRHLQTAPLLTVTVGQVQQKHIVQARNSAA